VTFQGTRGIFSTNQRNSVKKDSPLNERKLILLGGPHDRVRVSMPLLYEAFGALMEGAQVATRFAVDGESSRKSRPGWLNAACAFEVTGLHAGSAEILIEARTLREIDEVRFVEQQSLFGKERSIGDLTPFDFFGLLLASLVEGDHEEVMADRALLEACVKFAKLTVDGAEGIRLEGICGRSQPLIITPRHIQEFEQLRDKTPAPKGVRVMGTLDTISATKSDILLTLKDGAKIRARIEDHDPNILQELFNTPVVVSGMAEFLPSGQPHVLIVESISKAGPSDHLFEKTPIGHKPVFTPISQDKESGVAAFIGTWPGDETDDELLEALKELG